MATEKTLPLAHFDLEKRYDIYDCIQHEERLYENVKLVALRQLDKSYSMTTYLEFETVYGSRMLIATFGIHLICEHGTKPMFKVFRSWLQPGDQSTLS
jgi:hypothetical protein